MFLRIKQSHIHICVYGKYVYFFPAQSNPFGIVYTTLQEILKLNPMRVAQSLLWAVHFLHDQLKPSIGEEQVVNN